TTGSNKHSPSLHPATVSGGERQHARSVLVQVEPVGGPVGSGQGFDLVGGLRVGQRHDGGTGAGDDGRYAVRAQAFHQGGALRHGRGAVLLVQAVLGGRQQQLGAPGQGLDEQGGTAGVGGGGDVRDGAREQAARGFGEDRLPGDEDHRDDGRRGFHADRAGGAGVHPGQGEPAEQAGRDVVGVALDLGGEFEQRGVVQFGVGAYGYGAGGDDPGADGGRGGAESAAVRDAVGAHDLEAAGLPAEQVEGGAQGAYEQVPLVAREGLAALTGDVDVQSRVGHPDDHVVVEAQRKAEGVEARAEVGAGGGNAHPDGGSAEGGTGHRSMTLLEL